MIRKHDDVCPGEFVVVQVGRVKRLGCVLHKARKGSKKFGP